MCYSTLLTRRGQQRWYTRVMTFCLTVALTVALSLLGASARHLANAQETATTVAPSALMGRVVAVGIPGAGALSPVGTFHPGGPIHDKPNFAVFTRPGAVLDPTRLLVASTSNFGAPLAQPDMPPGAILSLDLRPTIPLVIPPAFASGDGQATAMEGCVQLLTANSRRLRGRSYPRSLASELDVKVSLHPAQAWSNAPRYPVRTSIRDTVSLRSPLWHEPAYGSWGVQERGSLSCCFHLSLCGRCGGCANRFLL